MGNGEGIIKYIKCILLLYKKCFGVWVDNGWNIINVC